MLLPALVGIVEQFDELIDLSLGFLDCPLLPLELRLEVFLECRNACHFCLRVDGCLFRAYVSWMRARGMSSGFLLLLH